MRRLVLLLSCLLGFPGLLSAQKADCHFLDLRIAPVAHRSAFVHGYLHGYEEGFHQADFDLHMGRLARGEYVRDGSPAGYRHEFGSKHMFNSGFHDGFRVGYADGAAGRSFRALTNVLGATASADGTEPAPSSVFDEGVRSGYTAGQHQGLNDARQQSASKPSPSCPVSKGNTQQEFCAAFASGYEMGYSDGFTNQAKTTVAQAAK